MRPLRVRMQAFGPYAGVQELDFADLAGHEFFLITGATGAGKTTVLDAMAFALYGDTSGGQRDARDMRSQHAAPDLLTEVEFDFTVGDDRYRILRRPQQKRPSRRGEKTVTQLQEATVWPLETGDGGELVPGKPLADGWTDVTKAAEDILGFRGEQFRQVVMLPQGRFQELLQAKSQDKEKILATLFDTAFYARVEQSLKTRAATLTRDHERLEIERATILGHVGAADDDDLETQRAAAATGRDGAAAVALARGDEHAAAQIALTEAQAVAGRLADLAAARERVAGLEALAGDAELRRSEVEVAERAAPLGGDAEAVTERARELEARELELASAREGLAAREADKAGANAALAAEEARAPDREEAAARARRFLDLKPTVEGIGALAAQVQEARGLSDAALAEAQGARDAATLAGDEAASAAQRLQETRAKAAGAAALKSVAEQAAAAARQRRDLDAAGVRHETATRDATRLAELAATADARYEAAVVHLRVLETDWQAGQAALLAASLQAGAPCPVCGSTKHPAPARPGETPAPDDDALEAARVTLERLFAERDAARDDLADAERRRQQAAAERDQLARTLGHAATLPLEVCDERAHLASDESAAAAAAEQALSGLEDADRRAREARDEALARAQAADATAAERRSAAGSLAATLAERRRGVPAELADPDALAAVLTAAEDEGRRLDEALAVAREAAQAAALALEKARADATHAAGQATAAREAAGRAVERFAARLTERGFADEAAWRAALRDPAVLSALAAEVKAHDDGVIAARATLEQAGRAAEGLETPDLDALRAAATLARARADEAAAAKAGLDARLEAFDGARRALDRVAAESAEIDERFAVIGRLAQVANGDNPLRLSFQRFVLSVHLDRVLEIATHRLRAMSGKRYDLERTDDAQGRSRTAGLDLEVFDAWTGAGRPVSTLSGGESFMASLSLALGLAQAVQELAGGIHLDTIFVDEGFGSLDSEALDLALTTLTSLQENGRLVGIISHLGEVKERVDARLEVSVGKTGSMARFVVP